VYTPDDIMAGRVPGGPTLVYDDDHYYLGSVIAERLRAEGIPVVLVTPGAAVSAWSEMTSERGRTLKRLLELDVDIVTGHALSSYSGPEAEIRCVYTGRARRIGADALVTVTSRIPNDGLYHELNRLIDTAGAGSSPSLARIGDCEAPGIIAAAIFSGHRYARELDTTVDRDRRIKYDRVFFDEA
jgi:dimethylamine/trimethylamine dehydrogenase